MAAPRNWGARPEEVAAEFPCDAYVSDPDDVWFRATDVAAPAEVVFRWLCQLKVAPYSYDLIDNLGRRSPNRLTPGLECLEVGQRVMTIFELVSFSHPHQITIRMVNPWAVRAFGMFALTYAVKESGDGSCRLMVKCVVKDPRPAIAGLRLRLLAWGDLVMMRRQLLNLRDLAERAPTP